MRAKEKNKQKKEFCPLCKVSPETVERLKKAAEKQKPPEKNKNNNARGFLTLPWAIVIAALIMAIAVIFIYFQGLKQITKEDKKSELLDDWPSRGDLKAPVLMVEYSDFACPFCGLFFQQTLPLIEEQYIKTGKVRFVYKDFIAAGGGRAAEAAHCAHEQDKFWEYHNLLFENQLTDKTKWNDSEIHKNYSQKLGLKTDDFLKCFEERRYRDKVTDSTKEGINLGVRGTPTVFVNNQKIAGAQSFEVFREIIEQELLIIQEK